MEKQTIIEPDAFPTNSHKSRSGESDRQEIKPSKAKPEERKVKRVISGNVVRQKKGLGKRVAELFLGDDTRSVGDYIFHDVLIPAAKSMICDMVGWGGAAELILFGGKSGKNTRRDGGKSYTSYGAYYKNSDRDRDRDERRDISRTSRARHDFDDIILKTRGEAEEVLSSLVDLTIDYQMASVADLYSLVGIEDTFTDNKYGWTDLRNATIDRVRGGYLINLPKPQPLD